MGRSARDPVQEAAAIWRTGVDAVLPDRLLRQALWRDDDGLVLGGGGPARSLPLGGVGRIAVVGAGKAGSGMAAALEEVLGEEILEEHRVEGLVCVPDDDLRPLRRIELVGTRSSPRNLPTDAGVAAAARVRTLVESLEPADLLFVLLSGGASALLPAPAEGVPLADKSEVTRLLQDRGADIAEVNSVRKHLSELKGGGIVRLCRAGRIVSLIVSDVMGDALDVIGSGPTAADPTTYGDALAVLADRGLGAICPPSVRAALEEGVDGRRPETLKRLPAHVTNVLLGTNATAVRAARRAAEVHGLEVHASPTTIGGDTAEVAKLIASFVVNAPRDGSGGPLCLLFGGETTADLGPTPGLGGRNMELVLAVLARLGPERMKGVVVLSGGTDGEDGPTDSAGAAADERTARRAAELGLDPADFLARHDSYRFFEKTGGLLRTGRTGTNVMDLRVVLVDPRAS